MDDPTPDCGDVHSRFDHRDALYELEMYRALLADAKRRNRPASLIAALEAEVAYWAGEVARELPEPNDPVSAVKCPQCGSTKGLCPEPVRGNYVMLPTGKAFEYVTRRARDGVILCGTCDWPLDPQPNSPGPVL